MKHQRKITDNNKVIDIYDDVFTKKERQFHLNFFNQSVVMDWSDLEIYSRVTFDKEQKNILPRRKINNYLLTMDNILFSFFDDDACINDFNFLNTDSFTPISVEVLVGLTIFKSYFITYSTLSTSRFHRDSYGDDGLPLQNNFDEPGKTLLYYINDDWNENSGGETLFKNFYNDDIIAVGFKPGRVVIFDATIEHKPSLATFIPGNNPRSVFVIMFR